MTVKYFPRFQKDCHRKIIITLRIQCNSEFLHTLESEPLEDGKKKKTLEIEIFFDHPSPVWEFSQLFFLFFLVMPPLSLEKFLVLVLTITFCPENISKLNCSKF